MTDATNTTTIEAMQVVKQYDSTAEDVNGASSDDELFAEWKTFLQQYDRPDLLLAATDAILQLPSNMLPQCLSFIPLLARLVHQEGAVSVNALRALLYLSSADSTNQACNLALLTEVAGISRLLEIVLAPPEGDHWRSRVNYAMALLANMSRVEEGALDLVGRTMPDEPIYQPQEVQEKLPSKPTLELLLAKFLNPNYRQENVDYQAFIEKDQDNDEEEGASGKVSQSSLDTHDHDPYQHFAAILMNATQIEAGRQFVMKIRSPDPSVLQKLLGQLRSPNPLRRRGVAGMIRNVCMERDSAWWMLNVVNINIHLLYPLAGPEALDLDDKQGLHVDLWIEGPDKVREPDHMTRLFLVESILLLLSTGRVSRQTMRLQRTYVILKMADLVEEQEDVSSLIYDCVNYLRRDEAGTTEGSSDALIEQTYSSSNVKVASVKESEPLSLHPEESPEGVDFDTVD
jgi:Domain of unknown function (DUF383)/Domain of unknown function (DUF384)